MGGRENPNEMWTSGQYCVDKKGVVLGPIVKTKPGYYYDSDGDEHQCDKGNSTKSTPDIFTKSTGLGGALQAAGLTLQQKGILTTLKQGFYINDSVNEILKEFGYDFKGKEDTTNWPDGKYQPDIRALSVAGYTSPTSTYNKDSDKIGISDIFKAFKRDGGCKIKFCTLACIRSPSKVLPDSIATLEFATAVNSCVNSEPKRSLAPVRGPDTLKREGAKILEKLRDDPAGLSSKQYNDRRLLTHTRLAPTTPGPGQGGMSSRKNKRAIHKSTLKANVNAKVKPSHVRVKRKSTTRKHRKSIKNNKNNKRTIKNRVEKMK
jgi:hypothetical protein